MRLLAKVALLLRAWVLLAALLLGGHVGAQPRAAPTSTSPADARAPNLSAVLVPAGEAYEDIRPLLSSRGRGRGLGETVAYSADGRWIATGTYEGVVLIWDAASGREHARLAGHAGNPVSSLAFSPDGRALASGGLDKAVWLWDVASWRERARLIGHEDLVLCVAFSPDGRTVASGGRDMTVRLWDVPRGRERARLGGHEGHVQSLAFSPDGRTLASGSVDKTIWLWDVASERETLRPAGHGLSRLAGHGLAVVSLAFSSDGRTLASGSQDKTVRLWDVVAARERARLFGHENEVSSVAFSPDGRMLASGSWDKTVRLWDVARGGERARLAGHESGVLSVAFSPDGRTLASGGIEKTVRQWDVVSGRALPNLVGHENPLRSVALSPDGRMLATGGDDKTVRLWDVASGRERARLVGHEGSVRSVAFSPDGQRLASGGDDETVRLWYVARERDRPTILEHKGRVLSLAFSSDGLTLASGGGTMRLWDVASGRERTGPLVGRSVAFSPDGRMLASGGEDKTVRLWDVASGRERARLVGHEGPVRSVAFSSDGRTLASGSDDATVRLWEVASELNRPGQSQHQGPRVLKHEGPVMSIAFGPGGSTLASGSWDSLVRLWDVASGRALAPFFGHEGSVGSVAFSHDGRTLASGSDDNTLRLWDPASGAERAITYLGRNGMWAACVKSIDRCYRSDIDGLPIVSAGRSDISYFKPAGQAQQLKGKMSGAELSSIVDASQPVELVYTVVNGGSGPAFWLELKGAADPPADRRFVLEAPRAMRLDAGQAVDLTLRVHLLQSELNPGPFDVTIQLMLAQAHGEALALPPVTLRARPVSLEVVGAAIQGEGEQRSLAVTVKNVGSKVGALAFEAELSGVALPAEVTLPEIPAQTERVLSFGLDPDAKLPSGSLKLTLAGRTQRVASVPTSAAVGRPTVAGSQPAIAPAALMPPTGLVVSSGNWQEPDGFPIYDWQFNDVPVRMPGLPVSLWIGSVLLLLALLAWTYVQRVYRHPLVLRLSAQPGELMALDPAVATRSAALLERASRLDAVLTSTQVERSWLDALRRFDEPSDEAAALALLARRFGTKIDTGPVGHVMGLDERFPLNLTRIRVSASDPHGSARDSFNALTGTQEVTLVLGRSEAQRKQLSALSRQQAGLLVAPDGAELTSLLLATDPLDALARLIARHVPVTQISPYQTGAGVQRSSMFFGRASLIAQVMGRDPANYLIVGGRQVGKSSLLKELARRFEDDPAVAAHYLVLSDERVLGPLAEALSLPPDSDVDAITQALRRGDGRRTLVIIDEVDAFVRAETLRHYQTLQRFRALSEPGHVQFVMAGFWSLFEQAVLDYQSPLKNFGTVLTVGALEFEACVDLATKPLDRLSIRWADPALTQSLVKRTGQRANLISIACNELINELGTTERAITAEHLRATLDSSEVRRALEGWGGLGATPRESQLDRIVVFATVDQDQFTLAELMRRLESEGLALEPETVRRSVMRLELAFVLSREGSTYAYQVPLQRELIQEQDPAASLRRELRGYGSREAAT